MRVDAHIDAPWQMTKRGAFSLAEEHLPTAFDLPRMKEGGLDAAILALYLPDRWQTFFGPEQAFKLIIKQTAWAGSHPNIHFALEGGRLIGGDLNKLKELHDLCQIKYLTLTHNANTDWADSATDVPNLNGLAPFGVEVIQQCNDLGIFVDVSHASDDTARAAIDASAKPVITSHSGCRAVVDHPRNLPDDLIRRIASSGGIIHVPFARNFIGPDLDWLIRHVEEIASVAGSVNHIGIGSDLDGAAMIDEIQSVDCWHRVVGALSDIYDDEEVDLITGGNTARLLGLEG